MGMVVKMMQKQGWKVGSGLGKSGQGMTTPLIFKKTSGNTAVIVNSSLEMRRVSRVMLLTNVVAPADVDEGLYDEVGAECSEHGRVKSVQIFTLDDVPEDQAVRIFVEFESKDVAARVVEVFNGRFFDGRLVSARLYDEASFYNGKYDLYKKLSLIHI
eukprot:TRINITY_DN8682_c0_g1_i1.p1 TRINITY_DN8682_c0_g1~~TRINITY_DN8682_c0_g1_i1.p1  ORF type:complete len:158 (-),score=28.81 TRINITY_DN8682_c0_g1_i1:56-529(-)